MKRAVTVLIMAMCIGIFVSANGQSNDSNETEIDNRAAKPQEYEQAMESKDANEAGAEGGMSKEMKEAWENIDKEGRDEVGHWSKPGADERLGLAKAAQNTVKAELMLIRKIAQSEGAEETMLAIDKILAKRNKRFDGIVARAEEEKNKKEEKDRTRPDRTERRKLSREERLRLMEERRKSQRTRRGTNGTPED